MILTQNNQNPVMEIIYEECKHHAGYVDIFFKVKGILGNVLYYCDYKKKVHNDCIKQWETEHPFEVEK